MKIDGWECKELWPGEEWAMREASRKNVTVQANRDGLEIEESYSGFSGASGRVDIPANVIVWLAAGIR